MRVEPMTDAHAEAVLAIYQAGIDEGDVTFETTAPSWQEFTATKLPDHRFVALEYRLRSGCEQALTRSPTATG